MWLVPTTRLSLQAMIAPRVPSLVMVGPAWLPGAVHTARPFGGHAGSATPEASTCWAKMSRPFAALRASSQVMIAPPTPSSTIAGSSWSPGTVHTLRPFGPAGIDPAGSQHVLRVDVELSGARP